MRIGLIDIDGHNYPNLALMKVSAFYKARGHKVDWVDYFNNYDIVYQSKVFTYTPDNNFYVNCDLIVKGGTGYDCLITLPDNIDKTQPDYSLYPKFTSAYGFITRGCPNKCSWCIVPKKEGNIHPYMDVEEIARDRKEVVLMDNNILASEWGLQQIEKIVKLKLKVDFNQGLDARFIARDVEVVKLLSKVKWHPVLRMSCDSSVMMEPIQKAVELLRKYGCKPQRYFIYVLLRDFNESYNRVNFCINLKLDVHSQPFMDFTKTQNIPQWQKDMAKYTNRHVLCKTVDFKDYRIRKNFSCAEYFK
ncbi:MAG: radical SAM protein [Bacteroidales bacterium]